jgi:hypothetical protein
MMGVELLQYVQLNALTTHLVVAGHGRRENRESQAWGLFLSDPFGIRVEPLQLAAGLS